MERGKKIDLAQLNTCPISLEWILWDLLHIMNTRNVDGSDASFLKLIRNWCNHTKMNLRIFFLNITCSYNIVIIFVQELKRQTYIPRRDSSGPLLYSVDHCFGIRGQGTVMTGTVLSGKINIGDVSPTVTYSPSNFI